MRIARVFRVACFAARPCSPPAVAGLLVLGSRMRASPRPKTLAPWPRRGTTVDAPALVAAAIGRPGASAAWLAPGRPTRWPGAVPPPWHASAGDRLALSTSRVPGDGVLVPGCAAEGLRRGRSPEAAPATRKLTVARRARKAVGDDSAGLGCPPVRAATPMLPTELIVVPGVEGASECPERSRLRCLAGSRPGWPTGRRASAPTEGDGTRWGCCCTSVPAGAAVASAKPGSAPACAFGDVLTPCWGSTSFRRLIHGL
mmetsp:Transcript_16195/g.61372  ORF Transcript_16195/g.61372 Transcript_16195/m.61372 type:complete len:257 (+) Transcript_16195:1027-1797(+)